MNNLLWPFYKLRIGEFKPLTLEELKREAMKKEIRLEDFGNTWYEEPSEFMIQRVNQANLSPVGHLLTRELFTRRLRVKLRLNEELKRSEVKEYCRNVPVREPIFIVGMVRKCNRDLVFLFSNSGCDELL